MDKLLLRGVTCFEDVCGVFAFGDVKLTWTKKQNQPSKGNNDAETIVDLIQDNPAIKSPDIFIISNKSSETESATSEDTDSSSAPSPVLGAAMAQAETTVTPLAYAAVSPSQEQLEWLQRHEDAVPDARQRVVSESSAQRTPPRTHPLPQIPSSPTDEQSTWLQEGEGVEQAGRERGFSESSIQRTPPKPSVSTKRKAVPRLDYPEVRTQEARASLSGVLSRMTVDDVSTIEVGNGEGRSSPIVQTPDAIPHIDLPYQPRIPSEQRATTEDEQTRSTASSGSYPRIEEDGNESGRGTPQEQETLQYHAFDDLQKKSTQNQASHAANRSVGSNSSNGDQTTPRRTGVPRSVSGLQLEALGPDLRGRTLSPHSARNSDHGSPHAYARDLSSSRRSPGSRPTSYVDLLSNLPYSQQVAPSGAFAHHSLQSAVGSAASLLDTKKTLEMYRANIKKTTDAAVQYEFAIYMVNCAQDPDLASEVNAAELISEAKTILRDLSSRGYPFAQYYLGDGYASGLFNKGKPDNDRAFPLFVGASKHQHAEAGYRAALCYEFGWGTAKSYPKAVQFYRAAAFKNHPGAATRLGLACLRNDMGLMGRDKYREGVKWLKRAQESADFQYNSAPFELGMLHLNGFGDDIFQDERYAAQLWTQSAELGHVEANFLMGQAYENGLYGCPRDAALSVHFYNGAATRGHAEAMMALCAWYMLGAEPVLDRDEREAYEWAKKSAETGFAKAEYAVGYFTEMGIGCRRDPLEANVWYVRAADQGNETAKQRLQIIRAAASGDPGIPISKAEVNGKQKKKFMGIF